MNSCPERIKLQMHWCCGPRQYFVVTDIFSSLIFCRQGYFVESDILASPIFCRQRYFVVTDILSKAIFWRRWYFFFATILSAAIFCRKRYFASLIFFLRRYFVGSNILSSTIIFLRRYFVKSAVQHRPGPEKGYLGNPQQWSNSLSRKPLRRTRLLRNPAQTQVWGEQVWLNTTFIS